MIEVSPKVPGSLLGTGPAPSVPCLMGSDIHKIIVVSVSELSEFCFVSEISFTKLISHLVAADVTSSNRNGDFKDSSSPSIIVSTIENSEGSVVKVNLVKGSTESFGKINTKDGQSPITQDITIIRIAVIT